jgi:hypothetical protein
MNNYNELSAEELRELLLKGELLHELMTEEDYTALLDIESDFDDPSEKVIDFCYEGLSVLPKYSDIGKRDFDINELMDIVENRKPVRKQKKLKKAFLIAAAVIISILAIQIVAVAMGYSIIDLGKRLLNIPEKTVTEFNDKHIERTDDFRSYDSMRELLESENYNILYPVELPIGYSFTYFEFIKFDNYSAIRAYALEPHITFTVEIGVDYQFDNYDYEINGIKYNIIELGDGLYQAFWADNTCYYWIVVDDKAILSEIIKNLILKE